MRIEFHFDVICPWTWITSRWLVEVAPARDLDVTWRTFSLGRANGIDETDAGAPPALTTSRRILRVAEAARAELGDAAVGSLYTVAGTVLHHDQPPDPPDIADLVSRTGLPARLAAAADDTSWDDVVAASTDAAMELAGQGVGVPIVTWLDDPLTRRGAWEPWAIAGPVLSPAPTGDAAVALWDAMCVLAATPGYWESKRGRDGVRPVVGPRPD